jgi:hypothetical protein
LLKGGPPATLLFQLLLEGTRNQLERLGYRPADTAQDWAPYQILFLILGPMLLEHAIRDTLDADPFDPNLLVSRSHANQQLIANALLSPK